jgi:aromatic-L-amino-acid decarboxylase
LGRPFRALKLWFVLRAYGLEGLRSFYRQHIAWAESICARLAQTPGFEIVTAPVLALFTFRLAPHAHVDLNALNLKYIELINDDGRIYLTQTLVDDKLVLRFQVGNFNTSAEDMDIAFKALTEIAAKLTAR